MRSSYEKIVPTFDFFQAMIDISAERSWLATVLRTQQLMQCIIQARWHDESPFMTLPHVESLNLPTFKRIRVREPELSLPGLKDACHNKYEHLAAPLRGDFEEPQIENIFKVIKTKFVMNSSFHSFPITFSRFFVICQR